jgi:hypothetical protein
MGTRALDVDGRWLRRCPIRRTWSPQAAEAEDDRLACELACRLLESLDSPRRVPVDCERHALYDEPVRSCRRCGVEQIRSAFTSDSVVCLGRSSREIGEEVRSMPDGAVLA